jgi:hypothetical protein
MMSRRNNSLLRGVLQRIRTRLGPILVSVFAIWSILSFVVKQLVEEASWVYAIPSGFLLTLGVAFWLAGTAVVLQSNPEE